MIATPQPSTEPQRRRDGQRLIATRGLPASGKSSWARAQLAADSTGDLVRCNRDDLRRMLHGTPRYDPAWEATVTIAQQAMLRELLFRGRSILVDDTNLNPEHLAALEHLAAAHGAEFVVQDFTDVAVETCIQRDARRAGDRKVGAEVIRDMHARWLAPAREPS